MQTARKPAAAADQQSTSGRRRAKSGFASGKLAGFLVFGALFAGYGWFVHLLQGIDGDTLFIALFCTWLTMFILKAFSAQSQSL